jgi:hypothetical protein
MFLSLCFITRRAPGFCVWSAAKGICDRDLFFISRSIQLAPGFAPAGVLDFCAFNCSYEKGPRGITRNSPGARWMRRARGSLARAHAIRRGMMRRLLGSQHYGTPADAI